MVAHCRTLVNAQINSNDRSHARITRRAVTFLPAALPFLTLAPRPSHAAYAPVNREVDNAESPLVQQLLARTAEKREERKVERLNDYYRRNFNDYFSFQAGSNMNNQGIRPETQAEIRKWLEENGDGGAKQWPPAEPAK